jgi:hypothetical protein
MSSKFSTFKSAEISALEGERIFFAHIFFLESFGMNTEMFVGTL